MQWGQLGGHQCDQETFRAASSGWVWLLFAEGLDDKLQIGVCALGSGELFWVCESGLHDDESGASGFIWPSILERMGEADSGSRKHITRL